MNKKKNGLFACFSLVLMLLTSCCCRSGGENANASVRFIAKDCEDLCKPLKVKDFRPGYWHHLSTGDYCPYSSGFESYSCYSNVSVICKCSNVSNE